MVRELLRKLGVPVMFSAPASYEALPVELVFGAIKAAKLPAVDEASLQELQDRRIRHLTNKQRMMLSVSEYLRGVSSESIKNIFFKQLSKLELFLDEHLI